MSFSADDDEFVFPDPVAELRTELDALRRDNTRLEQNLDLVKHIQNSEVRRITQISRDLKLQLTALTAIVRDLQERVQDAERAKPGYDPYATKK